MTTPEKRSGAHVSPCGVYRYRLWRAWDFPGDTVVWIMLNPSTADARRDDPTIRRCIDFTKRLGAGRLEVVNLYALRATRPKELVHHPDPVGPDNNHILQQYSLPLFGRSDWPGWTYIAAWGSASSLPRKMLLEREKDLRRLMSPVDLKCLGYTRDGHPRHPLYLPKDAALTPWP